MALVTSYICLECCKDDCYGIFPSRNYFGSRGHLKRCLKKYPTERPNCLMVYTNWSGMSSEVYCAKDVGVIGTKYRSIRGIWKFKPTERAQAIITHLIRCSECAAAAEI